MLPQADDDTLIAYAHLVVDEYTTLNAESPEDCYLYGKGEATRHDLAAAFGPALNARDTALQSRIVATRTPREKLGAVEQKAVQARLLKQLVAAVPAARMDRKSAGVAISQILGGGK